MGDALMPFYGEPWTEEGDIDGALEVMDTTLELNPKHLFLMKKIYKLSSKVVLTRLLM